MGGMTRLLLLLWAGVTLTTALDLQKRIIGGETCNQTDRLYHVKLMLTDSNGNVYFCGGSLIADKWILTAAHCWEGKPTMKAVLRVHPGTGRGQEVEITAEPVFHPDGINDNDIMLLKLPTPPVPAITPIRLPNCTAKPNIGDKVQIAGHGYYRLSTNKTIVPGASTTLRCVDINVVDCPDWLKLIVEGSHEQHRFCGRTPRKDAGEGDSGGGVVFNNMIYGVIELTPSVYVGSEPVSFLNVCKYLPWIRNITGLP